MQTEMMSEAIDDALDDDEAEEETDELTNQVSYYIWVLFFSFALLLSLSLLRCEVNILS